MRKIFEKIVYFEKETLRKFERTDFFERFQYRDFDNVSIKNFWVVWLRWVWKTSYLLKKRKSIKNSIYISCDWWFVVWIDFLELIVYIYKNYGITTFVLDEIQFLEKWDNILKRPLQNS